MWTLNQWDRIGRFLKFLVPKFLTQVAQKIGNFWGYFVKPLSYVNTAVATFGNVLATFL